MPVCTRKIYRIVRPAFFALVIFPSHVSRVGSLRLADSRRKEETTVQFYTLPHAIFPTRRILYEAIDERDRGRCWQWWFLLLNLHPRVRRELRNVRLQVAGLV